MTSVYFFSYDGKPNVANKGIDITHPKYTRDLNFVTKSKPELTFDIECKDLLDANYCAYVGSDGFVYWFIDSIEAFENIYTYHLSLDVLSTYFHLYNTFPVLIERCSSLKQYVVNDSKWLVGTKHTTSKSTNGNIHSVLHNTIPTPFSSFLNCVWSAPRAFNDTAFIKTNGEIVSQNAGMFTSYATSIGVSAEIAGYLLADGFTNNICKLVEGDPSQAVISFCMFPFSLLSSHADCDITDTLVDVYFGNVHMKDPQDQGYLQSRVIYSNVTIDLGYLEFPSYMFSDFRINPPYTKVRIFLPFIGLYEIDQRNYILGDEYSDRRINIKYHIDLQSCNCVVVLSNSANVIIDTINGNIGVRVPITGNQSFEVFRNNMNAIVNLASSIYSGFAGNTNYSETNASTTTTTQQDNVLYKKTSPNPKKETHKTVTENKDETSYTSYAGYGRIAAAHGLAQTAQSLEFSVPFSVQSVSGTNNMGRLGSSPFLLIDMVDTIADSSQNTIYGKLCLTEISLDNNDVKGFVKLCQQQLPMNGLRLDVYTALYDILTTGFYKTNTWS